jgi:predicted Zn-dependent protease
MVGKVDPALSKRVVLWIENNLVAVADKGAMKIMAPYSMETVCAQAIKERDQNSLATVVLVGGIAKHGLTHGFIFNRVAVIDVDMLRPADTKIEGWNERFTRRVEKESLAGVSYAMGMPACVFALCALKPAETTEELDAKGRNLCPPCTQTMESILGQKLPQP